MTLVLPACAVASLAFWKCSVVACVLPWRAWISGGVRLSPKMSLFCSKTQKCCKIPNIFYSPRETSSVRPPKRKPRPLRGCEKNLTVHLEPSLELHVEYGGYEPHRTSKERYHVGCTELLEHWRCAVGPDQESIKGLRSSTSHKRSTSLDPLPSCRMSLDPKFVWRQHNISAAHGEDMD